MITKSHTVKDVLMHNHFLEMVLERYDVLVSERNSKIEIVAKTKGVAIDFFVEILNLFDSEKPFSKDNLFHYDIPVVLDYLQRTHRYYLGKRLFELESSVDEVCAENYKDQYLQTLLQNFFTEFKTELWEHIEMEENFLFPHINFLQTAKEGFSAIETKRKLKNFSAQKFTADHNDESEKQLSELFDILDYLFPQTNFLSPVSVLKQQLRCFEKDLHIHALVEDEVLMPKVLVLEKNLIATL
jgi:regulator of cell morphogenesis and NO signaling